VLETQKIGEKNVRIEEEVRTRNGLVVLKKVKETLNIRKDDVLGERSVKAFGNVIRYEIRVHKNKDGSIIFYVYFFIVKNDITEIFKVINKKTAITMLSRINHIHEQKIEEFIPNFETEKEKVQFFDRINSNILTDKEIEENLNTVQSFSFFGQEGYCGKAYPHIPHVMDYYNTVRYGSLPLFCLGKSGKLLLKDGRKVQILITKSCKGNCHGKYAILEEEEE